jgi:molybdopterin-containing oxidoreductase family membrane subunit
MATSRAGKKALPLALRKAKKYANHAFFLFLSFVLVEGYIFSAALLIIVFLRFPTRRFLTMQLLGLANTLLLAGAMLWLLLTIRNQFQMLASKDEAEYFALVNRMTGPYGFFYWGSLLLKGLLPQVFWWAKIRRSLVATGAVGAVLLVDFFTPVLTVFLRDYLPSSWAMQPNYAGLLTSTALFMALFMALLATAFGLLKWRTAATRHS